MIRNIITPNTFASITVVALCSTIMFCTNLNMSLAILANILFPIFAESTVANSFRRAACSIFDVSRSKPYRFAVSVNATIALYTTTGTVAMQLAFRLLSLMLTFSRSRTTEQNAAALAANWNRSILFVSDTFAEKFVALAAFTCTMWICFLFVNLATNDIFQHKRVSTRRLRHAQNRAAKILQTVIRQQPEQTEQIVFDNTQQETLENVTFVNFESAQQQEDRAGPRQFEVQVSRDPTVVCGIRACSDCSQQDRDSQNGQEENMNQGNPQNEEFFELVQQMLALERAFILEKRVQEICEALKKNQLQQDTTQSDQTDSVLPGKKADNDGQNESVANQLPEGFVDTQLQEDAEVAEVVPTDRATVEDVEED